MQIILTHTTITIDVPDQCAAGPQPAPRPTDNRPTKAENPFTAIADLLGNLQTETKSGGGKEPLIPPWRVDYGTTIT